jgi:hypothetical protein
MTRQITGHLTSKGPPAVPDQITVRFVHPTDSGQTLTATVGGTATPHYLLDQLVKNDFLAKPGAGAEYKLVDTKSGTELGDHVTLGGAGVATGTTLHVLHSVTGA